MKDGRWKKEVSKPKTKLPCTNVPLLRGTSPVYRAGGKGVRIDN
jgi:hypothetical protein